jgi:hypothetical protein
MMAVAEALAPQGTVLGAVVTFVLYGLLPLSVAMYIMGTPGRRKLRRAAEAARRAPSQPPDGSGQAAGDGAVAPEGKEG